MLFFTGRDADPQVAVVTDFDGEGFEVVSRGQEAAAGLEVEFPVVPVADQHAVADAALGHRIPHMRTTVVDGLELALIKENSQMGAFNCKRLAFSFYEITDRREWVVDIAGRVDIGGGEVREFERVGVFFFQVLRRSTHGDHLLINDDEGAVG